MNTNDIPKNVLKNRILSPSELTCFRDCRQKWVYSYIERRPYSSTGDSQRIGLMVHAGLAAWYAKMELDDCYGAIHAEYAKYPAANKEKAQIAIDLALGIFEHYVTYYADDREKYLPLVIEQKLTDDRIGLKCIPDLVVQHKESGDKLIIDHKVQGELEINKVFDAQKIALFKVLTQKYDLSGIIYNLIRRKLPMIPELTVKGDRLKKFTPSSTTEAIFRRVVKENKLKLKDYPDIVKYYKDMAGTNDFFRRVSVRISRQELEDFEREVDIAREQMETGIVYKNRQWDCNNRCDYYEDCYKEDAESPKVL